MRDTLQSHRREAKDSAVITFLLMFAAHAYRFGVLGYTDDSVRIVQSSDRTWQISLGRFLQPVYWKIRGDIVAPYLIGILASLWLSMAVYLIVRMLKLKSRLSIVLVCALMTANATMTFSNASYISWSDVYMLSFLAAAASVAVWDACKWGFIASPFLLCISLALYQSYFQAAVLLYLIILCKHTLDKEALGKIVLKGMKALGALIAGLVLYNLSVKLVTLREGIERATSYNGIGNVGGYDFASLPRLLMDTYIYPFRYFMRAEAHNPKMTTALYFAMMILAVLALFMLMKKRGLSAGHQGMCVLLTMLMPLGMNAVYFIAKGMSHTLMIYSYFLFFVYPVYLTECLWTEQENRSIRDSAGNGMRYMVVAATAVIYFNNVVYANQVYVRRDLEFQSTLSVMTRVIDRAEQVEGYVPGSTPVAIAGVMYDSPLAMERPGFEHLYGESESMNQNLYATTDGTFYPWYFWQILGYPFLLVDEFERVEISNLPEVREMPAFPAKECCRMIDGTLVIKIGETAPLEP